MILKKTKNYKKLLLSLVSIFTPAAILASCGTYNDGSPKNQTYQYLTSNATQKDETVYLTTSQGKFWPLISALDTFGAGTNGLIPYYNKTFKDDADFVPVKLLLNTESKAISQAQTAENIGSILQNNGDTLPSVALADASTSFVVNRYNRLLDISKSEINPALFGDKISRAYNDLNLNNNTFYNIPFNLNDVDATSFNLDNLRIVFEILKQGGAKIDENMDIYKQAQASKDVGNSTKENNLFSVIKAKSNNSFADLTVNKETFTTIENALDFSIKFVQGIAIDESKKAKLDESTENISIFDIDYSQNVLIKNILSKTGKTFWSPSGDGTQLDYNIATDQELESSFKEAYNKFTANLPEIKVDITKNGKTSKKVIQAFQFKNFKSDFKGFGEWGSHDILRYKTAFGFVPAVGIKQSIDSFTSRILGFEDGQNFATYKDVYTIGQPVKARPNSPFNAYWPGGSSLIAIKTGNEKVDKGTIKFLNWLFKGSNKITGKDMSNLDYLIETSAYFVPTKETTTQAKLEQIKALYQKTLEEIKASEDAAGIEKHQTFSLFKKEKDIVNNEKLEKLNLSLYDKLSNLRSVIVSLESLLNHINDPKTKMILDTGNSTTNKISTTILDSLIDRTKVENSETKTAEQIYTSIQNTLKS
ncbi:P68 family surface lipoprotein [Mesomycoplasma conjunctivae]|uniref:P68 family surface lipoprotein n=1 Tax=Mesomycoplasma conjunctivae TaxID=45361 RepID=UPI003DA54818